MKLLMSKSAGHLRNTAKRILIEGSFCSTFIPNYKKAYFHLTRHTLHIIQYFIQRLLASSSEL